MKQNCIFDKVRDIQEHVPSLATDLNKAIETCTVQDTGVVADFNSIEEPNAIVGRVSDAFEAIDAQRAILAAGKAAKAKADAAAAASAAAIAAKSVSSSKTMFFSTDIEAHYILDNIVRFDT